MKILFISSVYYPDILGGGEISTKLAAESLVAQGVDVNVLCCGDGTSEIINGVKVNRLVKSSYGVYMKIIGKGSNEISRLRIIGLKYQDYFYVPSLCKRYREYFTEGQYDLIQTNTPLANMGRFNIWKAAHDLRVPISHVFRCPALVTNHGIKLLDSVLKKRNTDALKYVDFFAGPSQYILDYNSILDARISGGTVIPNSVEEYECKGVRKEKIILYAGALNKDKGVLTLADACMDIKGETRIVFIGKGELKGILESRGYEVMDWMPREQLYELMEKSWLLILPSEWPEAFGRVIVEAVHNGTIPLASRIAGIPEVLKEFPDLMFEPGNSGDIYNKIRKYLKISAEDYEELIMQLRKSFIKYSMRCFSDNWKKYVNDCINSYNQKEWEN